MGSGDRCGLQFRDPGSDCRAVKERPWTNLRRAVEDRREFVAAGSCVEFEHRGTEIKSTEFDSTFQADSFLSALLQSPPPPPSRAKAPTRTPYFGTFI
jgi:hypothetical protein